MNRKYRAFTLIEILVVLGIILLLAALLFPVFNRVRENGYQANCASNLKQIYFAVSAYRADTGRYPRNINVMLPDSAELANVNPTPAPTAIPTPTPAPNPNGTSDLKGGNDAIICPDDDTDEDFPHSSYGDVSNGLAYGQPVDEAPARYVWNYWGYNDEGYGYINETDAASAATTKPERLIAPAFPYDRRANPIAFSLSNRNAPKDTIITHCIFHRIVTADNLGTPDELYDDADDSMNARDIVLRLDGTAKAENVSQWQTNAQNGTGPSWFKSR